MLDRFQNRYLKDTIFRVGQDRIRKLSPGVRFVEIMRLATNNFMEYNLILKAMTYAFLFKTADENGQRSETDILFDEYLSKGLDFILQKVCGFELFKDVNLINLFKKYF